MKILGNIIPQASKVTM